MEKKRSEAVEQHLKVCDELLQLVREENRILREEKRLPGSSIVSRKEELLLKLGASVEELYTKTYIKPWFIQQMKELVECGVSSHRIVVEQRQALHPTFDGDPQRVLHRAMTPVVLAGELLGRVLRVVNQQVGTLAQLTGAGSDRHRTVLGHLMVG